MPKYLGFNRMFIVFVRLLCERTVRSRVALREEGQVELLWETPNELSAVGTLANADKKCQSGTLPDFSQQIDLKTCSIWPNTQGNGRSHDAAVRVYAKAGNVIETHSTRAISKSGERACDPAGFSGKLCL
jgi:hypothetical protein